MFHAAFTVHASPEALPATETIEFAGSVHPWLKLITPVRATIVRGPGEVRAVAEEMGLAVSGRSSGEALHLLGRAIADRYYSDPAALRDFVAEANIAPGRRMKSAAQG